MKRQHKNFMVAGAEEMIRMWLPDMKEVPVDLLVSRVQNLVGKKIEDILKDQQSILQYNWNVNEDSSQLGYYSGQITAGLGEMEVYVHEKAPIIWEILSMVAVGDVSKEKISMVILSSILGLLNTQNQKINAYQTLIGAFLYVNHISKPGLEVLNGLGICCSYSHLNQSMKKMLECM